MTLAEFISTYTGQAVDVDGVTADTGQCVQLVALYCQKVLNVAFPHANAKDWWNNSVAQQHFEQIPVGQPVKAGDIVVWGASTLINSPDFGHIDICVNPTSGGFLGFDSNWGGVKAPNGYPAAHEVQHTFVDVLGYLRLKGNNMYPNKDDLINFHNATGWLGHAPNDNDVAYWCYGTNNPVWPNGADAVWKKLLYDVTDYVLAHPPASSSTPVTRQSALDYVTKNLA